MDINELVERATAQAVVSGFTNLRQPRSVAEHVALITTEVAEMYEDHRLGLSPEDLFYQGLVGPGPSGGDVYETPTDEEGNLLKPVGIPSELADIVIRAANMAGEYGIDLDNAIKVKMAYNATRPHKHGKQS